MNRLMTVSAVAMLLGGCAIGPDFRRPDAPEVAAYRDAMPEHTAAAEVANGYSQRLSVGANVPSDWWKSFHCAPLDDLVERALKANPTIDAAHAALIVAQETAEAQRGAYWPQATASLSPSRQKAAAALSPPLATSVNPYSLHTAQVSIGYSVDVFGGNRRLVEALDATAEAQSFELVAARLSVVANLVLAAIQEASLRGQIDALNRMIAIQEKMLSIAKRQLTAGDISEAGVAAQEAALAQARAAPPSLRKQLAINRDQMIALVGGFPDRDLGERFDFTCLELPRDLPLSLPSSVVEQRPDVRSAEAQLHAASAQIGVAQANMLPQFSLDANVGSLAMLLGDLFKSGTGFWGVAGTVAQPLFAGGALSHRKAAAEATYRQAAAQYRATVVTAFQGVADVLHALELDAETLQATVDAERAAEKSLAMARRQAELGETSFLATLNAEQTWLQATVSRVQAQANRYADTAALFVALGGGWPGPDTQAPVAAVP